MTMATIIILIIMKNLNHIYVLYTQSGHPNQENILTLSGGKIEEIEKN